MMITIGVDAHKRVHVAVAVDAVGRRLGEHEIPNNPAAWGALYAWARGLGGSRRWGVEGTGSYGRGLAQQLVEAGETVYEVNPRLTAGGRRRSRRSDKSDGRDARAVALAVLREGPALPQVAAEDDTTVLDLLARQREQLVGDATALCNRIHQLLGQIDPEYGEKLPRLQSKTGVRKLRRYQAPGGSRLRQVQASAVRRLAKQLALVLAQAEELARQIEGLARADYAPLTQLSGVSLLTAGTLAGILGPGGRFVREEQLAAYAGVAPLEASSAGAVRHRLNRSGNRRLNAILYRIALTQSRHSAQARAYLQRRMAEGKTHREAVRALKRYIARAVWRLWQQCGAPPPPLPSPKTSALLT